MNIMLLTSPLNKDPKDLSMVSMLRKVEMLTLTVLESLLSSISGSNVPSKQSNLVLGFKTNAPKVYSI